MLAVESCDTLRGTVNVAIPEGATDSISRGRHYVAAQYGDALTLTAQTKGDAAFKGWAIDGTVVSTQATYTLEATQNVTITALFSPNTQTSTAIRPISSEQHVGKGNEAYNVAGQRIDLKHHRGVYVQGGKKRIR